VQNARVVLTLVVDGVHEGEGSLSAVLSSEVVQGQGPHHHTPVVVFLHVTDLFSQTVGVVETNPLVVVMNIRHSLFIYQMLLTSRLLHVTHLVVRQEARLSSICSCRPSLWCGGPHLVV